MREYDRDVPLVVIKRLPRYYRYLGECLKQGITRISSKNLSEKMGVTASQIRQDLNFFGGFGQQGYGYNIERLYFEIGEILGLTRGYTTIIVGAGNLGHALANHSNFKKRGFKLVGIFDKSSDVIGTEISGLKVLDINDVADFLKHTRVDIAILAVPKREATEVVDCLIELGIKGFWNFSYTDISVPDDVAIENVHLSDGLMTLSYRLTELSADEN